MRKIVVLVLCAACALAEKVPTEKLIEMARAGSGALEQGLRDTFGDDALQKGTAAAGENGEFIWAIATDKQPVLDIDLGNLKTPAKVGGLWVYQGKLAVGTSHKFAWIIDGARFGGKTDMGAFSPDSYPQPGAPEG